jgi:hypothetical protein
MRHQPDRASSVELALRETLMPELTDERIEELHELALSDAELTGGSLLAQRPGRELTPKEREIYDFAFRNAFARMNGY